MPKKIYLIYNPKAGKGVFAQKLSDVMIEFAKEGYEITVRPTLKAGEVKEIIDSVEGKYDIIACSGGDGTLAELISALTSYDIKPAIGYIPSGSTNDFALSLGLPMDPQQAAEAIAKGKPFACDIGAFNGKPFAYVAAFGLFTDVSYETDQYLKNIFGHAAYILEGMKRLSDIKSYGMRIEHDGEVIESSFVLGIFCNASSVGGFSGITGENVQLDDGLMEVLLVEDFRSQVDIAELIKDISSGEIPSSKYVHRFKTSKVNITCSDSISWTLDGEYGGNPREIEIVNMPRAIEILV